MKKFRKIEISEFDYNYLFNDNPLCAVCNENTASVIDIDIKTKKVRDLLCKRCKGLLIWANDDSTKLQSAYDYCMK